jgi:hypothetical protein
MMNKQEKADLRIYKTAKIIKLCAECNIKISADDLKKPSVKKNHFILQNLLSFL